MTTESDVRPTAVDQLLSRADRLATMSRTVDLNLLRLRLSSNVEDFPAHGYLPRTAATDAPADYELTCIEIDETTDLDLLRAAADRSFRSKRFREGFYLVHYFGAPAYLITRGHRFYVFGNRLERTVWPYFVKHILSLFAIDHGFAHLKGAAFAQGDIGTILVGGNGAGKTVFLAQACLAGAEFVSNTHLLIRDQDCFGIPSSLRLRDDPCYETLTTGHRLIEHMEAGDFLASPDDLFPGRVRDRVPVRNVVVVDYQPRSRGSITEVDPERMSAYLRQFSATMPVYGLKDDIYAYLGRDFDRFTDHVMLEEKRLSELLDRARCLRIGVDMLDPVARDRVLALLAVPVSEGAP